ncbi:hypothetical protein SAMN05518871_103422 [Psychrobacillus sp. OK028]|nr:hypothetical protein [Psychrobacillus sp. OK028]SDN14517.1 hypothetical protein SAMN05518871_103422 [Psychrobacillus sp. OK028]
MYLFKIEMNERFDAVESRLESVEKNVKNLGTILTVQQESDENHKQ